MDEILSEFGEDCERDFGFTHSERSKGWLEKAPDVIKTSIKSCRMRGRFVMDTWEGVGTDLSLDAARQLCATITNTDVADWADAAPRRMALFVAAVCKAAGEDVFASLLEGDDLATTPEKEVAEVDGTPEQEKKEERRTFRFERTSAPGTPAHPPQGSPQASALAAELEAMKAALASLQKDRNAASADQTQKGGVQPPVPGSLQNADPTLVTLDHRKWMGLDIHAKRELLSTLEKYIPKDSSDAKDGGAFAFRVIDLILRGHETTDVLNAAMNTLLFFSIREDKGVRAAKRFQDKLRLEQPDIPKERKAAMEAANLQETAPQPHAQGSGFRGVNSRIRYSRPYNQHNNRWNNFGNNDTSFGKRPRDQNDYGGQQAKRSKIGGGWRGKRGN